MHEHTPPPPSRLAALRQRNFLLLWIGQSVSMIGDGIFTVALALETLRNDNSATALALVVAARIVPTVLLVLFSGVIIDRVSRKYAMLVADLIRGGAVLGATYLIAIHHMNLIELIIMAIVISTGDAVFFPSSTAIVQEILSTELLVQGSALNATSETIFSTLIGPALGGLLATTLGSAWAFGIDAGTFGMSLVCIICMQQLIRPKPVHSAFLTEVWEGLQYCKSQPWLWATLLAAGIANFVAFSPLAVMLPFLVEHVLHQNGLSLGLVLAAGGVGGIVMSLLVTRFGAPERKITAMWLAWGLSALAIVGLGISENIWIVGICRMLCSAALVYGSILWNPLMQELVPRELLGRASSVDYFVSISLSPLGVVFAGLLAGGIGVRMTIIVGGVIATLTTAVLVFPSVRAPERRPQEAVSPSP